MGHLATLVTVLALAASSSAGPIGSQWNDDDTQCAKKCIAPSKFRYSAGTTYEFSYEAETFTTMEDASQDTARLSLTATALVHVISDCDMTLQLRDVTIQESDPESKSMRKAPESASGAAVLERQPLRFSFQDGVVDELCPSSQEELWALNVKRGVLSAFQNGMSSLEREETVTETDVSGRCPSVYKVTEKGWYSTTVTRSKDLLACSQRHHYSTAITGSPYDVQSPVQSLPLLNSTHRCQQTVDQDGVLTSALCRERHQFRPFSREASGAVTEVTQSLTYRNKRSASVTVQPVSERASLVFEQAKQEEVTRKAQQEAERALRELCANTQADIRPDTPRLFSSLVSAMRRTDTSGLKTLLAKVDQKSVCADNSRTKKFFVDALPMVSTEAAVTLMTELLTSGDVTGVEADMWLTSLALINDVTETMLREVRSLLTSPLTSQKAMLPVSGLVHSLCQRRPQCQDVPAVQDIMTSFEDAIGSSCYVNKKNLDQVLLGLRAIGNAGHVVSVVSTVNKCVTRSRNPLEVRVAAAQSFRRMPCDADRSAVEDTLEDNQEDSELRIASYLALMTCPDDVTLQRVQRLLETEDLDKQVGSFIWSHLSNLQETSSPHKQALRKVLEDVTLPASWDLGRLQFSRNYEGSAFLQRLNAGGAAEANLVWSSSSSLPRALSTNLTVDLWGRSLNLLDVGLRLEGLEYLAQSLLGPYGYFGDQDKDKSSDGVSGLDELKGWLYTRVLGQEMSFQRFQGLESLTPSSSFNVLDFLIKLSKEHDVSMTHSAELMDTSLTVPTSCGLPLSLKVKATASVALKAAGSVDLRKVSASPRSLHIDGNIRPSGAVRVEGVMGVECQGTSASLRMTSTLHSSTALKARVQLDRGRVLSLELDVPEDKMEIFDVSSEFSIIHNKVEKKQEMMADDRRKVSLCSGPAVSHVTGLELCAELTYPNASLAAKGPYFPFTGPVTAAVTLYNRDGHSGYKLLAKRVENKKRTMAQLSFNTPGSKVDRSLTFDLVINHEDQQLEVSAASPWKKAEFKGAITNTKKLKGVSGSVVTDDVNVYSLRSEVQMDDSAKNAMTLTPVLELRVPGSEDVTLRGLVSLEGGKTGSLDLTLTGLTAQPWTLKSAATNTKKEVSLVGSILRADKEQYSLRVGSDLSLGGKKVQIRPYLAVTSPRRQLADFKGSALYTQGKVLKADVNLNLLNYRPFVAEMTATQSQRKAAVRFITKASVKSSVVSSNVAATVNIKQGRLINGRATMGYSLPALRLRDKLVLMAKLSDRSTNAYRKYTVRSSLDSRSFPAYNTALKLNVDHKKKLTSGDLEVRYGPNAKDKSKRLSLSAQLTGKIKNARNVNLGYKMAAQAPELNVNVEVKGQHQHSPSNLDSDVTLSYAKGRQLEASVSLKDKSGKLAKMAGQASLRGLGSDISVKSALTQTSKKQWEHVVNMKNGGSKHSLSTVYTAKGGHSHDVTSTVDVAGVKPFTVSGGANLEWDDLQLNGALQQGKNTYGLSGSHKLAKGRNGKWTLEVTAPSRTVKINADAGKVKGNYEGSATVAWDAANDKDAKVTLEGMLGSKSTKAQTSHKARLAMTTPWKGYTDMGVSLGLDSSGDESSGQTQHEVTSKLTLGSKRETLTSSLMLQAPLSPSHVKMTFRANTPFRGYGSLGMTIDHTLDSKELNTKLSAKLQKEQLDLSLSARNLTRGSSRHLTSDLSLTSTWTPLKTLTFSSTHKDDGRHKVSQKVNLKVNQKSYSSALDVTMVDAGSYSADLSLAWPKEQLKTTWTHKHTDSDVTSGLVAVWGPSSTRRLQLDLQAQHRPGSLAASLALASPWDQARDWRVESSMDYGMGKIVTSAVIKKEDRDIITHGLTLNADASKTDMDFSVTSPWNEPISSKMNAKYNSFPMTASAEFSWEPRRKVTGEGSLTLNGWDDLDLSMRVTTPVRSMRSLAGQLSSRRAEDGEVVSELNLDLGMRRNVILTTRVQSGDVTGLRVKLTSPWEQLRQLDTGLEVTGQGVTAGKVKADFKVTPFVGQHEVTAVWNADDVDDVTARFRLDTPRDDFPYVQLVASSKSKRGGVRQVGVELELSPRQAYSLDSSLALQLPLVMDVSLRTPHPQLHSLATSLRASSRDTAVDGSAQVTYNGEQSVKATGLLDWSRGLDSSLTISTPFSGWEKSSAILRHEGQWEDFSSLADVTVGQQSVSANLKFLNKMKTDVTLTLTTPFAGWEKMEAGVTKKGDLSNLRGSARVQLGEEKTELNVVTKNNARKTRFLVTMTSPHSQDLKINVVQQHLGAQLNTEASASYGSRYSLDSSANLVISNDLSADLSLKVKAGGQRHLLTAAAAKAGPVDDLTLSASASLDKEEVAVTAALNTRRDVSADLTLRSPFNGYRDLAASLHVSGDLSSSGGLRAGGSARYMDGQEVSGDLQLTTSPGGSPLDHLDLRASLTSPWAGLESSQLTLTQALGAKLAKGDLSLSTGLGGLGQVEASYLASGKGLAGLKAQAKLTRNGESLVDSSLTHRWTSQQLATSLRLVTSALPELSAELDHQGDITRFTTKASAAAGGSKVSSDTVFALSGISDATLRQTLGSNVNGQRHSAFLELSKVSSDISDVTITLSGAMDGSKAKATYKASQQSWAMQLDSPVQGYRQMALTLQLNDDLSTATATASLEQQQLQAVGRWSSDDALTTSLELSSPFRGYSSLGGAFSWARDTAMISAHLQDREVKATGRYVIDEGNVDVITPFAGYNKMGAAFSVKGDNALLSAHLQDDKIEATGRYVMDDDMEGSVDVITPFAGYEKMGAALSVKGDNTASASGYLQEETVEAKGRWAIKGDYPAGSLEVTTPFQGYTSMGAALGSHSNGLTASANLNDRRLTAEARYDDASASLEVATPFRGYRQMGVALAVQGDVTGLMEGGQVKLQGSTHLNQQELVKLVCDVSTKDDVTGSLTLTSPLENFRQVGASLQHSANANGLSTEAAITYMDGKTISAKANFYNYDLRRVESSAELKTPFPGWEMTSVRYTHSGTARDFQCQAAMTCSSGHEHTALLKVDVRGDQTVQLTVKTPYSGFRQTELSHTLTSSQRGAQWTGTATYGQGQVVSSQLTLSFPDDRFSSRFDLQTPFTSDLQATLDFQGSLTSFTKKQTLKYGDSLTFAEDLSFQVTDSPLWELHEVVTYSTSDVSAAHSLLLRRAGPWSDVSMVAKAESNGQTVSLDGAFKTEWGHVEGNVKVNTPFEDYKEMTARWQHVGQLGSAFSTEGSLDCGQGRQVTAKLDFLRSTWRRLQLTAEMTTPLDQWTSTRAEYTHTADSDGFTCHADAQYMDNQRLTGDLRVTSSPHPEVTLALKTPWSQWEQMSATGSFQNDGLGKQEASAKMDLGRGQIYTASSSLVMTDSRGRSLSARLSTPDAAWSNLEADLSMQGALDDFRCSARLSSPWMQQDLTTAASVRYGSPFDLNAALALDTPLDTVRHWKLEVVNGERGSQKTSHVIAGWSGDQEVVVDGTWRHDSSWYERHLHADVSITSPFAALRQCNWALEHHATDSKYMQKVSGSHNGSPVVDAELVSEEGEVTLTLTQPLPQQYSLSTSRQGATLSLDWDRNDPSSNLRLTSSFQDTSDSASTSHDLDLKVIHPSRTVGAKYSLQSGPQETTSQGELYWGRGSNRRLFYNLAFNDRSRRSSSSYEGKVKVGAMSRALQLSGSTSRGAVSDVMDVTLHWDADRDDSKQATLRTSLTTSGDQRHEADVTLSVPAINQEVRVSSSVAVNQGDSLLDATTTLSLSPESSKTLTFTSTLKDASRSRGQSLWGGDNSDNSNYTLSLSLTHPHTDLDLALTSHLGASKGRYSAAVDAWYVTSGGRQERKNVALRGEIDSLRRQLTMEMVSPVKKVWMRGQVESDQPYAVSLSNRYDDDVTLRTDVTLDSEKRAFSVKTNYDLEHPERSLVLKAFYVNDTALQASLSRDHVTDVITDVMLALRLNTSTLLHSRLHWRPQALPDLQTYSIHKLGSYARRSKQTAQEMNAAIRQELSARYAVSAAYMEVVADPWMALVNNELAELSSHVSALTRQVDRLYRRHPFLQQHVQQLQDAVEQLADSVQQRGQEVSLAMQDAVTSLRQLPVGQWYQTSVDHVNEAFEEVVDSAVKQLTRAVISLDNYVLAARRNGERLSNSVSEAVHNVTSHPYVLYVRDSMDVTPYFRAASNKISSLRMPERYSAAVSSASARVQKAMNDVMNMRAMQRVKEASNEIYQEGVWAYNYWQVEENLHQHLQSIVTLLKEIGEQQLEDYAPLLRHFRFLQESRVTVWDPEQGEVQAQLRLPLPMEDLHSLPDVTPLVTRYNDVMQAMPNQDTVQYFYDNYVPQSAWWADNSTDPDLMKELKEYNPSKQRLLMKKRNYKGRRGPAVAAM